MNSERDARGETLVELVISIVILGIAAVAIFTGITVSITTSGMHRAQTSASVIVRDYAENIENTVAGGGYAAGTASYSYVPTDTRFTASITSAQCGSGTTWTACSAATDIGLQRLTLRVAAKDGRATEQLTIVVRKPCSTGSTCS